MLDAVDREPGMLKRGLYTTRDDDSIDSVSRMLNIDSAVLLAINQVYYDR
jgi:hypothetical protein